MQNLDLVAMFMKRAQTPADIFFCDWIVNENLGPEWKPTHSKLLLFNRASDNALIIYPDTGYPNAWKQQPYYSVLKETASRIIEEGRLTIVIVCDKYTFLLPDRNETHMMTGKNMILHKKIETPGGPKIEITIE